MRCLACSSVKLLRLTKRWIAYFNKRNQLKVFSKEKCFSLTFFFENNFAILRFGRALFTSKIPKNQFKLTISVGTITDHTSCTLLCHLACNKTAASRMITLCVFRNASIWFWTSNPSEGHTISFNFCNCCLSAKTISPNLVRLIWRFPFKISLPKWLTSSAWQ